MKGKNRILKDKHFGKQTVMISMAALLLVCSFCGCARKEESATIIEREGYTLVWQDEFDGDSLDLSKWSYQHGDGSDYGNVNWGNGESEWYTDSTENVYVQDGNLTIQVKKENVGTCSYSSGRIRTITDEGEVLFSTTYGRVEAKIKIEGGSGIWPAFWMLPVDSDIYGTWAASGELDIMEARGRVPNVVGGTAHFGQEWPGNTYSNEEYTFPKGQSIGEYHIYAIEWDPDQIRWFVDDECYFVLTDWYARQSGCATDYTKPAPFDVPFYILLNVAVGGNYDPQAVLSQESLPAKMMVDYVRVYHRNEGYEESEQKVNAAGNRHAVAGDVHNNGNMIYNYSFDQGPMRLDYWVASQCEVKVKSSDADHRLSVQAGKTATLTQSGFTFVTGAKYGVRFEASSSTDQELTVRIYGGKEGLDIIAEEIIKVGAKADYIYAFTFECEKMSEKTGAISFLFEDGSKLMLDDVVMMKIG